MRLNNQPLLRTLCIPAPLSQNFFNFSFSSYVFRSDPGTSTELLVTILGPHPTPTPSGGVITIYGRGRENSNFWVKMGPKNQDL